ncbi:outer membrane protein [Rubellicoccus peritrichatus]|uniref:Outer membrane beta-barrel protein n=1 Tax=Rubellicoccus peritrichatus TaxID=3080537 RepID=A0AAQ3LAL0_9BACT|nr:outer membrane beta-barrel protein [Puniceicoccus sp. CR14]WOO42320.1 outer membrane beta-barrel protein [Puniceicoccus sp. CR14]
MLKNILIVSTALSLFPVASHASDETSFYITARGGPAFFGGSEIGPSGSSITFEYETGYSFTGAIGYRFDLGTDALSLRTEFEGGYASAGISEATQFGFTFSNLGDINISRYMGNAILDIPITESFYTYWGVGLGYAVTELELNGGFEDSGGEFAYQGMIGIGYNILENLSIELGWKAYSSLEPEIGGVDFDTPLVNQAELGIQYKF